MPLAISGALVFSFLDLTTINIYSQVGLITLVGLIAKNGILIVEFANTLQARGLAKAAALREASLTRLRPVLMTSAATVFGHLPLVLVTGPGAEARNSIGTVLVAGMTVGTLFTLFVVPVFYSLIAATAPAERGARRARGATDRRRDGRRGSRGKTMGGMSEGRGRGRSARPVTAFSGARTRRLAAWLAVALAGRRLHAGAGLPAARRARARSLAPRPGARGPRVARRPRVVGALRGRGAARTGAGGARGEPGPADRGDAGRPGAGPARRHPLGSVPAGRRGRERDHQPVLGHRAAPESGRHDRPLFHDHRHDVRARHLGPAAAGQRGRPRGAPGYRGGPARGGDDARQRRRDRLPQASPARSGARDHPAERRLASGIAQSRPRPFRGGADDRARPPSGRVGAREHCRAGPGSRAADRADGEPAQHPAGAQPRPHRPRPAPHRADVAAGRPGRAPLGAPRAAPRHPPGGAGAGRGQRPDRRGQGGLLPADLPDGLLRGGERRALGPLHRPLADLAVRAHRHAADLQRRPEPREPPADGGAAARGLDPLRADHPAGVPRSGGRAHRAPEGPRSAGRAGGGGHGPPARRWRSPSSATRAASRLT